MQMLKKRIKEYAILAIFFFVVLLLYIFNIPIPCIFHKITGFYCPGCGITRMFISIFQLDFKQAFNYNEFAFCLLVISIIYLIINTIYFIITKKQIKIPNIIIYIILICLIIFGIIRNIPQFSFLLP